MVHQDIFSIGKDDKKAFIERYLKPKDLVDLVLQMHNHPYIDFTVDEVAEQVKKHLAGNELVDENKNLRKKIDAMEFENKKLQDRFNNLFESFKLENEKLQNELTVMTQIAVDNKHIPPVKSDHDFIKDIVDAARPDKVPVELGENCKLISSTNGGTWENYDSPIKKTL